MLDRRTFLGAAALAVAPQLIGAESPRKKMAVVTTAWYYKSHAWHMAERFLAGYPVNGKWHRPPFDVVSCYVDQVKEGDLSRDRQKEFGFKIYPTIAEALRNGGDKLAVDAVLVIGEHGDYPRNEYGQKLYPRYELFKGVVDVFAKDGRVAPMFNDKHLSWDFAKAKEMVDTVKKMKIPYLAGSSLPVTWRLPTVDLPYGADVEEVVGVGYHQLDNYDFHTLEMMQCLVERRKGGETGVVAVQGIRGPAVWDAVNPRLLEACLSRSQTLAQSPIIKGSHRYPTPAEMREWVKDPVAFKIEYKDGLKGTMLLLDGLVTDFTVAVKLKGTAEPLSTLFYLPPVPNVEYSAELMGKAEELFTTGVAPYPVERTLLTSGLVQASLQSLTKGKRLETPHLDVAYTAPQKSLFAK